MGFFLMGIFIGALANAEVPEPLSLQQAIETAKKNSPDFKKAELAVDSADWNRFEMLAEHLPHLDVHGTHFLKAKYARLGILFGGNAAEIPSAFPQSNFEIEGSILLFDGIASIHRYQAANLERDAAKLELSHARFSLEKEVQIKFYKALGAQELAVVADQNIQTLEQHLQLAQVNQRAGYSTNYDVLRIEAQLEEARAEKILAMDNVIVARRVLDEAMGIEESQNALDGKLPLPQPNRIPANLTVEPSRREDLQALMLREDAQDKKSSAASAAFWSPKIYLFGVEQFYKFGDFDPVIIPNSSFQNAYSLGLKLTWNLFDGGASIARSAQADNLKKIMAENSRKLLVSTPNEFSVWSRKYIYNTALYDARKRTVEKSLESVRLATAAVKAGTKTHSDILDAELELFRSRAGLVRAQLDASEALAKLELAVGHPL